MQDCLRFNPNNKFPVVDCHFVAVAIYSSSLNIVSQSSRLAYSFTESLFLSELVPLF